MTLFVRPRSHNIISWLSYDVRNSGTRCHISQCCHPTLSLENLCISTNSRTHDDIKEDHLQSGSSQSQLSIVSSSQSQARTQCRPLFMFVTSLLLYNDVTSSSEADFWAAAAARSRVTSQHSSIICRTWGGPIRAQYWHPRPIRGCQDKILKSHCSVSSKRGINCWNKAYQLDMYMHNWISKVFLHKPKVYICYNCCRLLGFKSIYIRS